LWNAQPNSLPAYHISGLDAVGDVSTATITLIGDQSPPSGGSISYTTGLVTVPSVPITIANSSDSQSGVNAASGVVTREQRPLNTATDSCSGSFPNTYTTTIAIVGSADVSASNGYRGVVTLTIAGMTNGAISTGSGSYLSGQASSTATSGETVTLVNNGASPTLTSKVTCLSGAATAVIARLI
jgi:hypothetical protein